MRVLLATTGSDGDIRPFFALAKGLLQKGHEVRLATSDHYQAKAKALGIPFEVIGPPWDDKVAEATFAKLLRLSDPMKQLAVVLDELAEDERNSVPRLMELSAESDLVAYPPLLVAAAAAARATNVKHVSVQFAPVHASRGYSPLGNLGPFLNGLVWKLAERMMRKATDGILNSIVAEAGIPPWSDVLMKASTSTLLDLVAVSPLVLPKDPAWPAASQVSGYLYLDEPDFSVDPALVSFCEGDAPVVIGFGSMQGFDQRAVTEMIVNAVRTLKRKVVIQSGWAGLGGVDLPSHVHVTTFVPHAWLFPKAACVVHHGGAGTTGAVFRAGVPQAIVWHLGDQPMWGRIIEARGVGPKAIVHSKVSSEWLRKQIDRMLTDETMKATAKAMGEKIRAEDGVANAVAAIEAVA